MALYQCIKFHQITFNTFRDSSGQRCDGRADGRPDKVVTIIFSPFGKHKNQVKFLGYFVRVHRISTATDKTNLLKIFHMHGGAILTLP